MSLGTIHSFAFEILMFGFLTSSIDDSVHNNGDLRQSRKKRKLLEQPDDPLTVFHSNRFIFVECKDFMDRRTHKVRQTKQHTVLRRSKSWKGCLLCG